VSPTSRIQEDKYLLKALATLESIDLPLGELIAKYNPRLPPKPTLKDRQRVNRLRNVPRRELRDAVLFRAVFGRRQILEVASDFFRNHLNVDINKGAVKYLATDYEREVIRAWALRDFGSMLIASAKHPAMLVYLDNALSRRPLSKAELGKVGRLTKRKTGSKERAVASIEIAKQRGLNENYARELLELHTLGVDNYYTQRDVIEVAKALTGWTVQVGSAKRPGFKFRPDMHCRGEKWFLGGSIRPDSKNPIAEGEEVIRRLLRHKGTARFLAWKLCRYFVDDDPPKQLVGRVASAFRRSKGNLATVYRAIYKDRLFFEPRFFQSKFKRPFEFLVSALRVTGARIKATNSLHSALKYLSEPIYECEDPTGYYDQAEAWRDPGVMAVRWQFAMNLARGRIPGVRIQDSFYEGLPQNIPLAWKDHLAPRILPAGMGELTRSVLDQMVREYLTKNKRPKPRELGSLIVGLLLGSPEFQRQ
jgi:uncharacterized protein (DUF1800 family)